MGVVVSDADDALGQLGEQPATGDGLQLGDVDDAPDGAHDGDLDAVDRERSADTVDVLDQLVGQLGTGLLGRLDVGIELNQPVQLERHDSVLEDDDVSGGVVLGIHRGLLLGLG